MGTLAGREVNRNLHAGNHSTCNIVALFSAVHMAEGSLQKAKLSQEVSDDRAATFLPLWVQGMDCFCICLQLQLFTKQH